MSDELTPVYDPNEPARVQENDWDCSVESTEWALFSWGRTPDDNWLEQSMIAAGVVDPAVGLCDASGAGLADWCNTEYGEFGYWAENEPSVSFDELAAEASTLKHPIMAGGRAFYHWVGVRGATADLILLANPAPGWKGVYDSLTRSQFAALGSWSMVRLTHPAAESGAQPEPPGIDYSPWYGRVGTGLLDAMAADGVAPDQDYSTWLPIGRMPAQIEECIATNGTVYRWSLTQSVLWRYLPS
jgi:hypothetical protein